MRTLLLVTLTTSVLGGAARAEGLRCGNRQISEGDRTHAVRQRCGEPASATRHIETRGVGPAWVQVTIDVWTYDHGPTRFVRHLTFENDVLSRIEQGDYGR